jgi:hypothetical protein
MTIDEAKAIVLAQYPNAKLKDGSNGRYVIVAGGIEVGVWKTGVMMAWISTAKILTQQRRVADEEVICESDFESDGSSPSTVDAPNYIYDEKA